MSKTSMSKTSMSILAMHNLTRVWNYFLLNNWKKGETQKSDFNKEILGWILG